MRGGMWAFWPDRAGGWVVGATCCPSMDQTVPIPDLRKLKLQWSVAL